MSPVIAEQREARRLERAQKVAESKVAKEKIVAEAEKLAEGSDWRNGANRPATLLDEWKALPRLDRGFRRHPVAAVLHRPHLLHSPPQVALRGPAREA